MTGPFWAVICQHNAVDTSFSPFTTQSKGFGSPVFLCMCTDDIWERTCAQQRWEMCALIYKARKLVMSCCIMQRVMKSC